MERFWNTLWPNPRRLRNAAAMLALAAYLSAGLPAEPIKTALAELAAPVTERAARAVRVSPAHSGFFGFGKPEISGQIKSLNFFTRTTGFNRDIPAEPASERGDSVFNSMERFRLKLRLPYRLKNGDKLEAKIQYDHQVHFGTYKDRDDFRIQQSMSEDRQLLDLKQTLLDTPGAYYLHRLYRASVVYRHGPFEIETGRQMIPWGVGHFFTPTDLFNPFDPTQIELEERDGVDAVNMKAGPFKGVNTQLVYTPKGRRLHPQRILGRISRDVKGYEVGVLGGRIARDHAVGMDIQGNIKDAAVRGEALYRNANEDRDFFKFTVNADYNFPHNILGLVEYHYNGQGRHRTSEYQVDRFLRGDITELAQNYLGVMVSHDLTSLCKLTGRGIMNLDDVSFYLRPEVQYEVATGLFVVTGAQIFTGGDADEYGQGQNLYFSEARYSF